MNKRIMRKLLISIFLVIGNMAIAGEKINDDGVTTIDSLNAEFVNWYNLDQKNNKVFGVSVNKAYNTILQNKIPKKKIIVAVIDGGVDIYHEDLQGKIWINADEIPGNGIDDDANGYIDDIHGWNFLGNDKYENINVENYEFVRIINDYKNQFDTIGNPINNSITADEITLYKNCYVKYNEKHESSLQQKKGIDAFKEKLEKNIRLLEPYTKSTQPLINDLAKITPANDEEKKALNFMKTIFKRGFSYKMLDEMYEHIDQLLNIQLNFDLHAREIIGDDLADINNKNYGNNDVKGPRADHGSFVAGIIAANRNNNLGINGIAENVEIMVLRTVPDGDEYDKDVALSIIYAVDNGANIINMSFGKDFSPHKEMVDKAIKYAEEKGVLLVHAAGNSAEDNDVVKHFPEKVTNDNQAVSNWITVGANSKKKDKRLAGVFSNYGNETVDIFAPGVDIVSLLPENKYDMMSGTSFSAPVVTGVAALVWSYYPDLSIDELKEVLLSSNETIKRKVLQPNKSSPNKTKVKFSELSVTGGIVNAYNALQMAELKTN